MYIKNLVKSTLILSLLASSSFAFAQAQMMQRRTPEERAQRQTQWMKQNLSITDDQAQKAYNILFAAAKDAQSTNAEAPGNEKKSEREAIMAKAEDELKTVLTADQYQKYVQHMQEMKEKMQQRGGGMQGGN